MVFPRTPADRVAQNSDELAKMVGHKRKRSESHHMWIQPDPGGWPPEGLAEGSALGDGLGDGEAADAAPTGIGGQKAVWHFLCSCFSAGFLLPNRGGGGLCCPWGHAPPPLPPRRSAVLDPSACRPSTFPLKMAIFGPQHLQRWGCAMAPAIFEPRRSCHGAKKKNPPRSRHKQNLLSRWSRRKEPILLRWSWCTHFSGCGAEMQRLTILLMMKCDSEWQHLHKSSLSAA